MTDCQLELLPPNDPMGHHQRRGERIERKAIELHRGRFKDFITDCTLIDCDIRLFSGWGSVNMFGSTLERCTFRPRQEVKNTSFCGINLLDCRFLGQYYGCRFGREFAGQVGEVRDCDFSGAGRLHLCEFCDGSAVEMLRWPPWPHIVVTCLPQSRDAWLRLRLPEELHIVQQVIGLEGALGRAATLYLPAETDRFEELREVFGNQSYVVIA